MRRCIKKGAEHWSVAYLCGSEFVVQLFDSVAGPPEGHFALVQSVDQRVPRLLQTLHLLVARLQGGLILSHFLVLTNQLGLDDKIRSGLS